MIDFIVQSSIAKTKFRLLIGGIQYNAINVVINHEI